MIFSKVVDFEILPEIKANVLEWGMGFVAFSYLF